MPAAPVDYSSRIARLQSAMNRLRFSAILLEPGAAMSYFLGIPWGRSERPFLAIISASGPPVYVLPGFEEMRAKELIHVAGPILTWQEDASPYSLAAEALGTGARVGVENSVRFFIVDGIQRLTPHAVFDDAEPALDGAGINS
jgi:Xaa-Pro dipeptidase